MEVKTTPVHWNWAEVPDFENIPIFGIELAMALYGFNDSGQVTITWNNHVAVADYIFEHVPFQDSNTGKPLSRDAHIRLMRQCIGFQRYYM